LKATEKRAGSGSGSVNKWYGSPDPDQIVTDPEHHFQGITKRVPNQYARPTADLMEVDVLDEGDTVDVVTDRILIKTSRIRNDAYRA
jgi:hypothetical protein